MTKFQNVVSALTVSAIAFTGIAAPMTAMAQGVEHRKKTRDEWKNLGLGAGALALLGLVTKNGTLTLVGAAGGLYSAYRYEQDRKSADKMARQRAELYSRSSVVHNGKRYYRKTVWKNGKKYYTFNTRR